MFSYVAVPACSSVSDYTPNTEKLSYMSLIKVLNGTLNFRSMLKSIKTVVSGYERRKSADADFVRFCLQG